MKHSRQRNELKQVQQMSITQIEDQKYLKQGQDEQVLHQEYAQHNHYMKSLSICSKAFQKISKSYFEIKTNVLSINEVLNQQYFNGISHSPTKLFLEYVCQANGSIADHCKEYSLQLHNLYVMYAELVKERYAEFRQQKQNYHHYLSKVKSLSKSPQIDRFQRNKDKLKNAYYSFQVKTKQLLKLLKSTNQQAEKTWEKKIINFSSTFVKMYSQVLHNTQCLIENNSEDQIIIDEEELSQQLNVFRSKKSKAIQELCENLQKTLASDYHEHNPQILVTDFFKQNQHKSSIQKIFGHPNSKFSSNILQTQSAGNSQIFKSKQTQKIQNKKNDFSVFENILSQKKQTKTTPNEKNQFFIQIPSGRPGSIQKVQNVNKSNNKNDINLLDL